LAIDGGGNTGRANGNPGQCLGVACPPAFTPKAGPVTPTCGMHVTTSIVLGADTPSCNNANGLIVDADGITIDLNGHVIQGNQAVGTIGINVGNHGKVTIKNGAVRTFEVGINSSLGQ